MLNYILQSSNIWMLCPFGLIWSDTVFNDHSSTNHSEQTLPSSLKDTDGVTSLSSVWVNAVLWCGFFCVTKPQVSTLCSVHASTLHSDDATSELKEERELSVWIMTWETRPEQRAELNHHHRDWCTMLNRPETKSVWRNAWKIWHERHRPAASNMQQMNDFIYSNVPGSKPVSEDYSEAQYKSMRERSALEYVDKYIYIKKSLLLIICIGCIYLIKNIAKKKSNTVKYIIAI